MEITETAKRAIGPHIQRTLSLYPCDLLFVHRDAEREFRQTRIAEVSAALAQLNQVDMPPAICVIPVRMQEAWLLFDEVAIRYAANNRFGKAPLLLPALNGIESLVDPKQDLYELLRKASGLGNHRLRRFSESRAAQRVSDLIDDFSPLRIVPAFAALEADIVQVIAEADFPQAPFERA